MSKLWKTSKNGLNYNLKFEDMIVDNKNKKKIN